MSKDKSSNKYLPSGNEENPSLAFRRSRRTGLYYSKEDNAVGVCVDGVEHLTVCDEGVSVSGDLYNSGKVMRGISDDDDLDAYVCYNYLCTADVDDDFTLFTLHHEESGSYIVNITGGAYSVKQKVFNPINISRYISVNSELEGDDKLKITEIASNNTSTFWNEAKDFPDEEECSENSNDDENNLPEFSVGFENTGEYTFNIKIEIQPLTLNPNLDWLIDIDEN